MNLGFHKWMNGVDSLPMHTGMRPYKETDTVTLALFVSKNSSWNMKHFAHLLADHTWLKRKMKYESFFAAREKDVDLEINPILTLEMGRDVGRNDAIAMYKNVRGFIANVHITKKFAMSTSFYENQVRVQTYLMEYANKIGPTHTNAAGNFVIDAGSASFFGQGRTKRFKKDGYDFAMASGYLSFSPTKNINVQFGTDKLFIGYGYRSLLLSDNSFVYPMVKTNVDFLKGRLRYTAIYASLQNLRRLPVFTTPEATFERKAMTIHYASFLVNKKLELGFMETTIWQRMVNFQQQKFDYSLLNPLPIVNLARFGFDSTNNNVVGLQARYKVSKKILAYAQVMIDGFTNNVKAGYQLGATWFEPMNFKNLIWRLEYNYVSPYSYTNSTILQNYSHYNMPLAHPWGAGFNEWIFFFNWRWDDFFFENKLVYGNFKMTDGKEYGKDIFLSDIPPPVAAEIKFGQTVYWDLKGGYLINPITNLSIHLGLTNYYRFNGTQRNNSNYLYIGLSTALSNIYFDI
ncbi:MAG TPA: capsule assembly Wzi family protein [Flavobacteriales bacterium]|nr:capsule assembly Wzi family protein [Flavobacteriales bacterium]